jgi:hypothetical protein
MSCKSLHARLPSIAHTRVEAAQRPVLVASRWLAQRGLLRSAPSALRPQCKIRL